MLLCDIGNTSYHFFDGKRDFKEPVKNFDPTSLTQQLYYISVNHSLTQQLQGLDNWINLEPFIDKSNYYDSMGIDRVVATMAVDEDCVIVDAGSAVTVDVVKNGKFEGGFIYPGRDAMQKAYENISSALALSFNFDLALDIMPKNSQDAISYGYLKTLYCEVTSHHLPIVLTGGNAGEFLKIFKTARVDEKLIFSGMQKIIQKANIC